MGMISEAIAADQAKRYASMLTDAIESGKKDVISFCKKHIYKSYLCECSDGWLTPDNEIVNFFENVQDS